MVSKQFWKDWKNKTKIELDAIKALNKARRIIFDEIKKENIISIYIAGSFIRREMNKNSDIDLLAVARDVSTLKKFKNLKKKYKIKPRIDFTGYTFWELKNSKKVKAFGKLRRGPKAFVSEISDYYLMYGENLEKYNLPSKDPKVRAKELVNVFNNQFMPEYKRGVISFDGITKQVLWLTNYELKSQGKNPKHSFKDMVKLSPKNHIVKEALKLRKLKTIDSKVKSRFISKLKIHLKKLEKRLR